MTISRRIKMSTNCEEKTYQSKHGYHPCDYKTFIMLKKLNSCIEKAKKKAAAWNRWHRKDPHNRHGNEPKICPIFSKILDTKTISWNYQASDRTVHSYWANDGRKVIEFKSHPKFCQVAINSDQYVMRPEKEGKAIMVDSFGIDRDYRNAKRPAKSADDVKPIYRDMELLSKLLAMLE